MSRPYTPDAEVIGKLIGACIREALLPIKKRIDALEADRIDAVALEELAMCSERVDELEKGIAGRGLRFMGRHSRNAEYQPGDITTANGSLWVASKATREVPGQAFDWQKMLTSDLRGFKTEDVE